MNPPSIPDTSKWSRLLFGKGITEQITRLIVCVWLTIWVGTRIRDVEQSINSKFHKTDQKIEAVSTAMGIKIEEARAEARAVANDSWTIYMMADWNRIAAEWNPTNRVPDVWRIYHDVRAGRPAVGIRIGP